MELKEHQLKEISNETKRADDSLVKHIERLQVEIAGKNEAILTLETDNKEHNTQIKADFEDRKEIYATAMKERVVEIEKREEINLGQLKTLHEEEVARYHKLYSEMLQELKDRGGKDDVRRLQMKLQQFEHEKKELDDSNFLSNGCFITHERAIQTNDEETYDNYLEPMRSPCFEDSTIDLRM